MVAVEAVVETVVTAQPTPAEAEVVVATEVVEVVVAAPAVSAPSNGRAPNDPREVRRRKREEAAAAAAAAAAAHAPASETAAQEQEHESKPLA